MSAVSLGRLVGPFELRRLDERCAVLVGRLPRALVPGAECFEEIWGLHPLTQDEATVSGRRVRLPRWQQNYERSYRYSGQVYASAPLPKVLAPIYEWSRAVVDERLNGMLANWYDGVRGHYIGKHRDSIRNLIPGSPIVTISLGEARSFRLRPWRGAGFIDLEATEGSVIIIPFDTNAAWTHEVPCRRRERGRRVSLTLRAFAEAPRS